MDRPFEGHDICELTAAHASQHLDIELVFHDSIQQAAMMLLTLLSHKEIRCEPIDAREQVASEVFVLKAHLDHDCDLDAVRQDFLAATFTPSDLHVKLIQRTSHVTFEGLCQDCEQQ